MENRPALRELMDETRESLAIIRSAGMVDKEAGLPPFEDPEVVYAAGYKSAKQLRVPAGSVPSAGGKARVDRWVGRALWWALFYTTARTIFGIESDIALVIATVILLIFFRG